MVPDYSRLCLDVISWIWIELESGSNFTFGFLWSTPLFQHSWPCICPALALLLTLFLLFFNYLKIFESGMLESTHVVDRIYHQCPQGLQVFFPHVPFSTHWKNAYMLSDWISCLPWWWKCSPADCRSVYIIYLARNVFLCYMLKI